MGSGLVRCPGEGGPKKSGDLERAELGQAQPFILYV